MPTKNDAGRGALAEADRPGPPLKARMGLHLGEAEERGGDYFGPVVNTAARVEAAGHGGQVLVNEAVRLTADIVEVSDLGSHRLRDVAEPVRLFQLGDEAFPPLRVVDPGRSNLAARRASSAGRTRSSGSGSCWPSTGWSPSLRWGAWAGPGWRSPSARFGQPRPETLGSLPERGEGEVVPQQPEAMTGDEQQRLDRAIGLAVQARASAYARYSRFAMGAAVVGLDGRTTRGVLVENVSLGLSMCAERVALFNAVTEALAPALLAVCAPRTAGQLTFPCGACLQVGLEIAGAELVVVAVDPDGVHELAPLVTLLTRAPKRHTPMT